MRNKKFLFLLFILLLTFSLTVTAFADDDEPLPEPCYSVSMAEVCGWHTEAVTVEITVTDEGGTGYEKAEVCADKKDPKKRISVVDGHASLPVTENGTIYVLITDHQGKLHEHTLEVGFFDLAAPKISASVRQDILRIEATDEASGISLVTVNGILYSNRSDGLVELNIRENTSDSVFYVRAEDNVGNLSDIVIIGNPFYKDPTATPEPTPTPTPTPTPAPQSSSQSGPPQGNSGSAAPSASNEPVELEKGTGFENNGSAVTRDLLFDKFSNKQFITLETRGGSTLYLVIDYDKPLDEDGDRYETYFLNLVDESDLLALIGDDDSGYTSPFTSKCICTHHCEAGDINMNCPVCSKSMVDCASTVSLTPAPTPTPTIAPTPPPTAEPEQPGNEQEQSGNPIAVVIVLLAVIAGGVAAFIKLRKKPSVRGNTDLGSYDYGTDENEQETIVEEANE